MKTFKLIILFLLLINTCFSQTTVKDGLYFGQTPPGDSAIIFAPGIISLSDRLEGKIAFSPDGSECYFTVWGPRYSSCKIYYTKYIDSKFSGREEASFSLNQYAGEPFISADGKKLFFDISTREKGTDIWMVQRTSTGWGEAVELPYPVNTNKWDAVYSESVNGTVCFASNRAGGLDERGDIWKIVRTSDETTEAENVGATVNSAGWEAGTISTDGSYFIFTSERAGGHSYSDLYVSFIKNDGQWTEPVNLEYNGSGINISDKNCNSGDPSLSPDGKYLFFTRRTRSEDGETADIYWISTKLIDDIKNEVFNVKTGK